MSTNPPTFLILDGNALLHRAWHAIPPLTTKDGLVVNAVYGFAMVIEKMRERFKPDYMAVAWDLPGKTFRHEKFEAYKATRVKKEQELYDQIPLIQKMLEEFHVPSIDAKGFEADDVIGTLSKMAGEKNFQSLIVTGDLDALQLVDEQTHVVFFQKGISETKLYDIDAVKERYGLTPHQLIDYKAFRGDPSDNLPGIAGIGEKTATTLMQTYGSLAGIFSALKKGEVESKMAKKLEGKERAAMDSRELVEIVRTIQLPFTFESAKVQEPDWEKLLGTYRRFEFRTLLRKHEQQIPEKPATTEKSSTKKSASPVLVVRDVEQLKEALAKMQKQSEFTIGILLAQQQADLFGSTHAALALSDGKTTVVVPNPAPKHLQPIEDFLEHASLVVVHDVKHLMHQTGWTFRQTFDTLIASYLLDSGSRAYELPFELPIAYATQKDYEKLGSAVCQLPQLAKTLKKSLEDSSLLSVFEEIDIPLIDVLYKMETAGILLDSGALNDFSVQLKKRIEGLDKKIQKLAGVEFNVASPIQLADVLFETLSLPTKGIKKTKTGYSTAASELEKLWDAHEIVPLIGEFRELSKLQSTYVETLPKLVDGQGRIHTTYNQTIAATGRLSSIEPNLQNIPIKTELGRQIRKAFIAPKGKVLIAADYSQIELRLAAVIAKDQPFIRAFQEGADIHTRTASEVWEVAEVDVTPEQRRAAKAINFGVLYGMGPHSLSRSTGLSFAEAKSFIDRYFEIHHAIRAYLDETKLKAHTEGYVETLFGRRRSFPEIESGIPQLVAAAERMAINMPVQGTAADLMKKSMLAVDGWLKQSGLPATMLLQVHDELVFEVEKDAVEAVARGVKEMMEGIASFEVPLAVDVETGGNWGEMKSYEI
ncbi:MAG: DNA polymerase I [Patescibacteria group bacterium]